MNNLILDTLSKLDLAIYYPAELYNAVYYDKHKNYFSENLDKEDAKVLFSFLVNKKDVSLLNNKNIFTIYELNKFNNLKYKLRVDFLLKKYEGNVLIFDFNSLDIPDVIQDYIEYLNSKLLSVTKILYPQSDFSSNSYSENENNFVDINILESTIINTIIESNEYKIFQTSLENFIKNEVKKEIYLPLMGFYEYINTFFEIQNKINEIFNITDFVITLKNSIKS